MPRLEETMSVLAERVLKRSMTREEMDEIYRISDAVGMRDVQSFLHLLLVFKLHEDTMKKQFDEMAALERKIHETLESSIEKILGEGGRRIGADMGDEIASRAERVLVSVEDYHSLRGQTLIVCFFWVVSAFAYWLGTGDALRFIAKGGIMEALLFLPAGWCVFLCGAAHTFLWVGDHWKQIKRTLLFRILLVVQIFFLLAVVLTLL
jgi:hypothetical protein